MGIQGFYKLFNQNVDKELNQLKGSIVIIDALHLITKKSIGIRSKGNDILNDEGNIINHLVVIIRVVKLLLKNFITPFFIFDGGSNHMRNDKIIERKLNKIKFLNICENIKDKKSDEYIKYFKRVFILKNNYLDDCRKLLTLMGIPWMNSIYEADFQCAALAFKYSDKISGVITDDSDIIVIGSPKIFKDFNLKTQTFKEINFYKIIDYFYYNINIIRYNNKKYPLEYNIKNLRNYLIDYCILLGSDYGKLIVTKNSIKNYSKEILKSLVLNNFNIYNTINSLKLNNFDFEYKYFICDDYLINYCKIKDIFLNSDVIIPNIENIKLKKINEKNLINFLKDKLSYKNDLNYKLCNFLNNKYTNLN